MEQEGGPARQAPRPGYEPAGEPGSRPWAKAAAAVRSHPEATTVVAFVAFKALVLLTSWLLLGRPTGFLVSISTAWDGEHYLRVARHGWDPEGTGGVTAEYHWPPLFPLTVRALGAHEMAPFMANNLAAIAAVALVTRLMGLRAGLFFALFPSWVAFSTFGYTEGLFVLLAAGALVLWRGRRTWMDCVGAGVLAGASIATRYAGLFPFLAFGAWSLRYDRRRALLFAGGVGAVGAALAAWHLHSAGTLLAYPQASEPWGRAFGSPWAQIDWIYHGWFTTQGVVSEPPHFWLLRNLAFMVPSFYGLWRLLRSEPTLAAFSAGVVVLTLFAAESHILGIPRYLVAGFPAIAVLGLRVHGAGWVAYGAASLVASCWILTGHLTGFFS